MSNILMILIPIFLSLLAAGMLLYIMRGMFNIRDGRKFEEGDFFQNTVVKVQNAQDGWSQAEGPEIIMDDLDRIRESIGKESISLLLFRDSENIYSTAGPYDSPILDTVLEQKGRHFFAMDSAHIYSQHMEEYTVLVVDDDFFSGMNNFADFRQHIYNLNLLFFLLIIAIILVTNVLLTRMVLKSIMIPLDNLIYGVHQIRDGNLKYRITYNYDDEFQPACLDFNEMAGTLMEMVEARQKDDENRRELIAGISHDLRTPLTSIKAYTEGLETGVASTPELKAKYLSTIKSKTEDLEHIVSQLFLFSKLDVGSFPFRYESLDIGRELDSYVSSVKEEYRDRGEFREGSPEFYVAENVENVFVRTDRVQLLCVFNNILENSIKYGNPQEKRLVFSCRVDGPDVEISMADNGPGVPPEALEKLFNVFYRSDKARTNPGQGSGLGLAISAKIVQQMGGSIRARNIMKDGAAAGLEMLIRLPVLPEEETKIDGAQ